MLNELSFRDLAFVPQPKVPASRAIRRTTMVTTVRVSLIHSFYSSEAPSGENQSVVAQYEARVRAGMTVQMVSTHSDDYMNQTGYRLRAGLNVALGLGQSPEEILQDFQPDIIHIHNLFPNWSHKWILRSSIPMVMTIHNFRLMCAVGTLQREGATCTSCPSHHPIQGLLHGCYRNSRLSTLPLTIRQTTGVDRDIFARMSAIIFQNDLVQEKFHQLGWIHPSEHVIPNFLHESSISGSGNPSGSERWAFVGRGSPEKGLVQLLRQWPSDEKLDVYGIGVGDIPFAVVDTTNVRFLGIRKPEDIRRQLPKYRGLVFPSRWPEGAYPRVAMEALSAGIPIAALEGSSGAELVRLFGCGEIYTETNDKSLKSALDEIRNRKPNEYSRLCTEIARSEFSEDRWAHDITSLYVKILSQSA